MKKVTNLLNRLVRERRCLLLLTPPPSALFAPSDIDTLSPLSVQLMGELWFMVKGVSSHPVTSGSVSWGGGHILPDDKDDVIKKGKRSGGRGGENCADGIPHDTLWGRII